MFHTRILIQTILQRLTNTVSITTPCTSRTYRTSLDTPILTIPIYHDFRLPPDLQSKIEHQLHFSIYLAAPRASDLTLRLSSKNHMSKTFTGSLVGEFRR